MVEDEIFAVIEGYDYEYKVSTYGRVFNVTTGHELSPINKDGNLHVQMIKDGKHLSRPIAKLVAIAFIPNHDNYSVAYHLSSDCLNNRVDNIAWGTASDVRRTHVKPGFNTGSCVTALTLDGLYQGTWVSSKQASEATGVSESCIRRVVANIRSTAGNLQWALTTKMQAPKERLFKCKCCGQLKTKDAFDSIPKIKYHGKYKVYDGELFCTECIDYLTNDKINDLV